jgi:GT2 family glycosyltransferase
VKTEEDSQPPALEVSVIIPTLGRPAELRKTLESIAACRPAARETLVIDQSGGDAVAATVAEFAGSGAVCIRSGGRGIGLAVNEALRQSSSEIVLATHDDCSVAKDWIAVGHRLATSASPCVFTGRVLPDGNPEAIPSTKDDPDPRSYTGEVTSGVLFPANMVLPRSDVLAFGGFDERFKTAAEDNDFSYRWLKEGRCLRYEPGLVVWHRAWRSPEDLRQTYVRYWREQGRFYAKHLRQGDGRMVRFLLNDARFAIGSLRELVSTAVRGRRARLAAGPRGLLRGLLPGLLAGLFSKGPPSSR